MAAMMAVRVERLNVGKENFLEIYNQIKRSVSGRLFVIIMIILFGLPLSQDMIQKHYSRYRLSKCIFTLSKDMRV